MTWNSTWPIGNISVKANRATGAENTSYITTTMAIDHYWNESATYDGRHKQVSMQAIDTDLALGGVGGILWYRNVSLADNPRVEMFYRNSDGIYQVSPSFKSGSIAIPSSSSYTTITDVPANCYGEIFMYTTALGKYSGVRGFFRSDATTVEAWSYFNSVQGSTSPSEALKFGNDSEAVGLNLRARRDQAGSATWNYRITYRGL